MKRLIFQAACHLATAVAILLFTSGLYAQPPQSPTQQEGAQTQEAPPKRGAGKQGQGKAQGKGKGQGKGGQQGKGGKGGQGKGGKGKGGKGKGGKGKGKKGGDGIQRPPRVPIVVTEGQVPDTNAHLPDGTPIKVRDLIKGKYTVIKTCLLYTSPSPRDQRGSRMPSSA